MLLLNPELKSLGFLVTIYTSADLFSSLKGIFYLSPSLESNRKSRWIKILIDL
jgi:hypothetical protein